MDPNPTASTPPRVEEVYHLWQRCKKAEEIWELQPLQKHRDELVSTGGSSVQPPARQPASPPARPPRPCSKSRNLALPWQEERLTQSLQDFIDSGRQHLYSTLWGILVSG